jgi:hypothetical protein
MYVLLIILKNSFWQNSQNQNFIKFCFKIITLNRQEENSAHLHQYAKSTHTEHTPPLNYELKGKFDTTNIILQSHDTKYYIKQSRDMLQLLPNIKHTNEHMKVTKTL